MERRAGRARPSPAAAQPRASPMRGVTVQSNISRGFGTSSSSSAHASPARGIMSRNPRGPQGTPPRAAVASVNAGTRNAPTVARHLGRKVTSKSSSGSPAIGSPTGSGSMIQARLNPHRSAHPFARKVSSFKTPFSEAYNAGVIPCHINHGNVNMALTWNDDDITRVAYDPVLVLCFEGLRETEHPYVTVARLAASELLYAEGAAERVIPILPRIVTALRAALHTKDSAVFVSGLEALIALSECVGPHLTPLMLPLLAPINSRLIRSTAERPTLTAVSQRGENARGGRNARVGTTRKVDVKEMCRRVLATLEEHGGENCLSIIRSKVPTYTGSM